MTGRAIGKDDSMEKLGKAVKTEAKTATKAKETWFRVLLG